MPADLTREKDKMIAGALYRPGDPELVAERAASQRLQLRYNKTTVADAVEPVPGVKQVDVDLVWEPPWGMDMMSDEARLELGFM